MEARFPSAAMLMLAACASSSGFKGRPISAFGPQGITEQPTRRHALLVGIDHFEDSRFNSRTNSATLCVRDSRQRM